MNLSVTRRTGEQRFEIGKLRALIAKHLDVDINRVADEAYLMKDLGADWLDHLELMILIEDQFEGLEIADDDADQMEVVGDLIRYIESYTCRGDRNNRIRQLRALETSTAL